MISYITGDLFKTDGDLLGHGCNCLGVSGAGVAKVLVRSYPEVIQPYKALCEKHRGNKALLLGRAQFLPVTPHPAAPNVRVIANLFTQINVGTHQRQVDYDAVHDSLTALRDAVENLEFGIINKVALPRIGAGLAGGDWPKIKDIMTTVLTGASFDVTVYWLPPR
jgi:O-acetyl-ADP-ribose deacetylase (regulator of RNase III)